MATVLHVGCGGEPLPAWLDAYDEVRLDIDPGCAPDVLAPMTDLGRIGPFDALYCCHAVEHLYPHDVPVALREFQRVLKPGGYAVVVVPDLEGVEPTEAPLYDSPAGPICGLDMIYGKASMIAKSPHMAHHCGFVQSTLLEALTAAGFAQCEVRRTSGYNLIAVAVKSD
jgi:ubiquinone/menaquinone biosynthesis C-methylase UbiE